jgi:hypothetical protein
VNGENDERIQEALKSLAQCREAISPTRYSQQICRSLKRTVYQMKTSVVKPYPSEPNIIRSKTANTYAPIEAPMQSLYHNHSMHESPDIPDAESLIPPAASDPTFATK